MSVLYNIFVIIPQNVRIRSTIGNFYWILQNVLRIGKPAVGRQTSGNVLARRRIDKCSMMANVQPRESEICLHTRALYVLLNINVWLYIIIPQMTSISSKLPKCEIHKINYIPRVFWFQYLLYRTSGFIMITHLEVRCYLH